MRVLIATPDFPPAPGGIQVLIDRLGRHLTRDEVTVVTLSQEGDREFDADLPFRVKRVSAPGPRRVSILALNAEIPIISAKISPDAIISGHIVCGPGALVARGHSGPAVVQYVYAMELTSRGSLATMVLPRTDTTIAITDYSQGLARALGARPHRITVVYPGVDPPPPASPMSASPVILTIGRLQNRYKGFDVMLRAMPLVLASVPDAQWVVLGDGRLRSEVEATANRAGFGARVSFRGRVSDAERDEWLARARVFAMPSRVPAGGAGEGFGIVYLEAGRFGVPSVAGREGGAAEAVLDGITGTLVDPRDHIEVAEALTRLLLDDDMCRRYGAAARERAAELSWKRMAQGVEACLSACSSRD
jgi:phosphatidylinositol alpha-1,6-mannosyltransferase